MEKTYRIRSF